jgi:hypothetical protein
MPSDKACDTFILKKFHSEALSPVHKPANLLEPVKLPRPIIKFLLFYLPGSLFKPSNVARCKL